MYFVIQNITKQKVFVDFIKIFIERVVDSKKTKALLVKNSIEWWILSAEVLHRYRISLCYILQDLFNMRIGREKSKIKPVVISCMQVVKCQVVCCPMLDQVT